MSQRIKVCLVGESYFSMVILALTSGFKPSNLKRALRKGDDYSIPGYIQPVLVCYICGKGVLPHVGLASLCQQCGCPS